MVRPCTGEDPTVSMRWGPFATVFITLAKRSRCLVLKLSKNTVANKAQNNEL